MLMHVPIVILASLPLTPIADNVPKLLIPVQAAHHNEMMPPTGTE